MAVKKYLSPAQVLSAMRKDGKPSDKLKRVEGILNGTTGVYSVSVRSKVKVPPNKAKIYAVAVKNKRSAIFIEGMVDGKKVTGILANVHSSSVGAPAGRSASRRRSSSRRRKSRSSRRRSKSPKRRRSKSKSKRRKSRSRKRRRSSRRR